MLLLHGEFHAGGDGILHAIIFFPEQASQI